MSFDVAAESYDRFMGRWSSPLTANFYDVVPGPTLRLFLVRRSRTYSAGAPAISAASAMTPR